MCHSSCLRFGAKHFTKSFCSGKRFLDVGSLDVNGSLRSTVESFTPKEYIGVDVIVGNGVDHLCPGKDLISFFGKNSFDVVLSTEVLEHVYKWKEFISNIKRVCKPLGYVLLTARSRGFPYHPYPKDFWRFEISDFTSIFSDFKILEVIPDSQVKGVFIFAQKPLKFTENDLSDISVFKVKPVKPKP